MFLLGAPKLSAVHACTCFATALTSCTISARSTCDARCQGTLQLEHDDSVALGWYTVSAWGRVSNESCAQVMLDWFETDWFETGSSKTGLRLVRRNAHLSAVREVADVTEAENRMHERAPLF